MTTLSARLTSNAFENAEFDEQATGFEFIVGNCHFYCNCIIADFLSPNIARLRDVDVAMSSYCICRIEDTEILKSNVSL
jgi:hypothetical protein